MCIRDSYNVTQNKNHHLVALFSAVNLIRQHIRHAPLLGVQRDGILHPMAHDPCVKGAADVVGSTHLKGTVDDRRIHLGRNNNDRNGIRPVVLLHMIQYRKAVHLRHHQV